MRCLLIVMITRRARELAWVYCWSSAGSLWAPSRRNNKREGGDGLTAEITECAPRWESARRKSARENIRNRGDAAILERSKLNLGYEDETAETRATIMFTVLCNINLRAALWYNKGNHPAGADGGINQTCVGFFGPQRGGHTRGGAGAMPPYFISARAQAHANAQSERRAKERAAATGAASPALPGRSSGADSAVPKPPPSPDDERPAKPRVGADPPAPAPPGPSAGHGGDSPPPAVSLGDCRPPPRCSPRLSPDRAVSPARSRPPSLLVPGADLVGVCGRPAKLENFGIVHSVRRDGACWIALSVGLVRAGDVYYYIDGHVTLFYLRCPNGETSRECEIQGFATRGHESVERLNGSTRCEHFQAELVHNARDSTPAYQMFDIRVHSRAHNTLNQICRDMARGMQFRARAVFHLSVRAPPT